MQTTKQLKGLLESQKVRSLRESGGSVACLTRKYADNKQATYTVTNISSEYQKRRIRETLRETCGQCSIRSIDGGIEFTVPLKVKLGELAQALQNLGHALERKHK